MTPTLQPAKHKGETPMKRSEELTKQLEELDAKAAKLEAAEVAAKAAGDPTNWAEHRKHRLGLAERRGQLVAEHKQALASETQHEAGKQAAAERREDNTEAVADLESDVEACQTEADDVLGAFEDLDVEVRALFGRLRDANKRASELYPQCERWGVTLVHVALTDAIRNYAKLGTAYRLR